MNNKSKEKDEMKLLLKYVLPNIVKKYEDYLNKTIKKNKNVLPSVSLTNKKKSLDRNYSAQKANKFILFKNTSKKLKIRLENGQSNNVRIRYNYSLENFKANNTSNNKNNYPYLVRNNELNINRFITEQKEREKKIRIRPFSSYNIKAYKDRKQDIVPKQLFNNIKQNNQYNFLKAKKFVNKAPNKKNKIKGNNIFKLLKNDEINFIKGKKDLEKKKKEEQEKRKKKRKEYEKIRFEKIKKERKRKEQEKKQKEEEEEEKMMRDELAKIKKEEEEKRKKEEEEKRKKEEEEKTKKMKEKVIKNKTEKVDLCTSFSRIMSEERMIEDKEKEELKKGNEFPKKPNSIFDKTLCDDIVSSLPKREDTTLKEFKKSIFIKTQNLSEKEKAFVLFKWVGQNIDYDVKGLRSGKNIDCSKEGVFKSGKTVCSGYSNLYCDIALYLDLNVVCIPCYAKGSGYIPGEKITASSTNHEYNAINLDGKWYPIDATWGSGYSMCGVYVREFNEFYFLADPELLIKTHFPSDEKWQLTKKVYKLSEFEKWPKVFSEFYQFGFQSFYPEEGYLELNDANSTKFILYGENMKNKDVICSIYSLDNNNKETKVNEKLSLITSYDDKIEVNCSFNEKGIYLIYLLGNGGDSLICTSIISYKVKVANNSIKNLDNPTTNN